MTRSLIMLSILPLCTGREYDPDLPWKHLQMFYNQFPHLKPSSDRSYGEVCWGYERSCRTDQRYSNHSCPGDYTGWAESRADAELIFYKQADFGYIAERREEIHEFCSVREEHRQSSLRCASNLQFCEAKNMLLDLRGLDSKKLSENLRYRMDVLKEGDILLNCDIDLTKLKEEQRFMSPLQSWAPELRNARESDSPIDVSSSNCDLYIDKPVYIMKLDAYVNMYHHFCDFFNLYASLFLRSTNGADMFDTDNQVLIWENFPYFSNFGSTWRAFTKNPILNLKDLAGKRICMKDVVFPLLPRMLYGLYYNTPIITGCRDSGLFQAFSEFIIHRLGIQTNPPVSKLRVTLLSRSTKHRRIVNVEELVSALDATGRFHVSLARFDHRTDFVEQLQILRNTDILAGIHGAGLTHMLFLPAWAGVFELYHCDDPACYSDLARLRGLKYITWQNEDKLFPVESQDGGYGGPAHQKFRNYKLDVTEFLRLAEQLEDRVRNDERYITARGNKVDPTAFNGDKEEL